MIQKSSEELAPAVAAVLRKIFAHLSAILPGGEVHHIGATAVPGALTKGDLDVLVRVNRAEFAAVIDVLRQNFSIKQPQNWDAHFASFGNDSDYALPLGVQLVVKDSEADFFLFVRDYFVSHPEILADYNRLKQEHAHKSAGEYWAAKNKILAPIVAFQTSLRSDIRGSENLPPNVSASKKTVGLGFGHSKGGEIP